MRIKKYVAETMREALLQIKKDLGEDAVILKTRKLPKKLFVPGSKDEIEVTAALDENSTGSTAPAFPSINLADLGVYKRQASQSAPKVSTEFVNKPVSRSPLTPPVRPPAGDLRFFELREDIRELKDLLKHILQTGETAAAGGFAGGWAILYRRLIDAEVNSEVAKNVILSIKGGKDIPDTEVNEKFISVLGGYFPVGGQLQLKKNGPVRVALVGPTGAGKTTTIAKLAAHYALNKGKKVSLITTDTYRIAAIEQIRTFADIIGLGLHVVFSQDEVEDVFKQVAGDDVVFIDSAGRSQKNTEHLKELEAMIKTIAPDEVHLVVSATSKDSHLLEAVGMFKNCGVNRLLFTKLDETSRLGNIFNVVSTVGIPVSYFAFGQNVPEDIELAQPGRFVQRLWEGSSL